MKQINNEKVSLGKVKQIGEHEQLWKHVSSQWSEIKDYILCKK